MELTPKDHDLEVAVPRTIGVRVGQAALLVLLPALLVLEWTTGSAFSLSLFYLVPVALAAWNFGYRAGLAIAAVAAGYCVFVAFSMHPAGMRVGPLAWQSATTLAMFMLFAWAVAYHRAFIERASTPKRARSRRASSTASSTPRCAAQSAIRTRSAW